MMKREQIFLSKNFTVIESDIPFTLKFNIKDNTANSAEDIINFKSGWYIFDNNKLLPQYVDGVYNLPKYNCWIEYDETLWTVPPHWYTCYINPKSVESLSSEVTELDSSQLALLRQDIQINGSKIDSFALATHEDLGAVKTSVDALAVDNVDGFNAVVGELTGLSADVVVPFKSANHSDLLAVRSSIDAFGTSLFYESINDLASNIRADSSWEGHYYCNSYFVFNAIHTNDSLGFSFAFAASSLSKVDLFLSVSRHGITSDFSFRALVNSVEVYSSTDSISLPFDSSIAYRVLRLYCAGSPFLRS